MGELEMASRGALRGRMSKSMDRLHRMAATAGIELPVLGGSRAMRTLLDSVCQVASTHSTVLLRGETGTGKGLIASLIHRLSPRAGKPFVDLVCGTLPPSLIESELFGHEKGAFTGAHGTRPGRFELAADGTIFLDEISDLPAVTQVKLLRVLQDRKFERVGGAATHLAPARIIVATNRNLDELVQESSFRLDLLHRLKVVVLDLPPLRERREDIPALVSAFLAEFGAAHRGYVPRISARAVRTLQGLPWPGNVRELRNTIERLVVLDRKGRIDVADLPEDLGVQDRRPRVGRLATCPQDEERTLREAIARCGGNKSCAAEFLGLSRAHFYRLLGKHSLLNLAIAYLLAPVLL
jgi:Nif-specific regulatory protein